MTSIRKNQGGIRKDQGGVVLIEAMIGILIFSLGVLALVAMQAVSTSNISNARFRSEAAFLANEIAAAAWMGRGTVVGTNVPATLPTYVWPGGNATTKAWADKVATLLPQADTYPPTITQAASARPDGTTNGTVLTITIRWKAPDALVPSNHVVVAYVTQPD